MHPLLRIALRAATDAARALAHQAERLDRISVINDSPDSFLTSADQGSDQTLVYHIHKAYPGHSIHSRVSGLHSGDAAHPLWLIDPLTGNINFARGYARFGVSVAVQGKAGIEHGVIINPMQQDEFTASRGAGAQLNSRRIRVRPAALEGSLLGLDTAGGNQQRLIDLQMALLRAGAMPRIGGSSPLDAADTACGRLQGGWCGNFNTVSMAAANLILQEAGGLSGTASGNPRLHSGAEQLFGDPKLFKQLLALGAKRSKPSTRLGKGADAETVMGSGT